MQANLDPKHRDRLAFLRIISGVYKKGMKVKHSRSRVEKLYTLSNAMSLFGQNREVVEVGYPGDVIGINNPGSFAIGDTLYSGTNRLSFPGIPSFSPEKFAYIRNTNPGNYKSFTKGLSQLIDEGAIQLLRHRGDESGTGLPILAAVGTLQFDVVLNRLKHEYHSDCTLEYIDAYTVARWVSCGWEVLDECQKKGKLLNTLVLRDRWQRPVILFMNSWSCERVESEEKDLGLCDWSIPPLI